MGYIPGEKGLGRDLSGTVVVVGSQVQGWKKGDELITFWAANFSSTGALTDYLLLDPESIQTIVKKPKTLSWEEATGLPLVSLTAITCLEWLPGLENSTASLGSVAEGDSGQRKREVLVIGASGGVGIVTVQFARLLHNCRVTGICSSKNTTYVKDILGADSVIDYTSLPNSASLPEYLLQNKPSKKGWDLIIDCVGGTEVLNIYSQLLHSHGSYVTIVGPKTSRLALGGPRTLFTHPQQFLWMLKGIITGPRYGCVLLKPRRNWLQKAVNLAADGKVRIEIEKVIRPMPAGRWMGK